MKKILLVLTVFSSLVLADLTREDDGIVTDTGTNLQWNDDQVIRAEWKVAIEYCENLDLGGKKDWRLPNINELFTITEYGKYVKNPAFTKNGLEFWSSTSRYSSEESAWYLNFASGNSKANIKDKTYYVRCVRIAQ